MTDYRVRGQAADEADTIRLGTILATLPSLLYVHLHRLTQTHFL